MPRPPDNGFAHQSKWTAAFADARMRAGSLTPELLVSTQFRTENRFTLFLELL